MIVQKYGGTSLENTGKILKVAEKIIEKKRLNKNIIVVVSAMGDTTNNLIKLAREISLSPSKRELDALLSTGEQEAAALLSMALNSLGCRAVSLTGGQVGIATKGDYTKSKIVDIEKNRIEECLKQGKVVVVAGFQGINEKGDITTLGRGGSDTSAIALAAKFACPCEIYTDVDGIYSRDPNIYKESSLISNLDYELALEIAKSGARVIDENALSLAKKYNVPITIGNTFKDDIGTIIGEKIKRGVS